MGGRFNIIKKNIAKLLQLIVIVQLVGILAGILSSNSRQMYMNYIKPPLSPPGWLFGIVWAILYLLMAISLYIISQEKETPQTKMAINLFWVQLLFNFIWPIAFFRLEFYWLSVLIIILLDILVFATTKMFYKINELAGLLMIPYLLWILFATYLNISIAILN